MEMDETRYGYILSAPQTDVSQIVLDNSIEDWVSQDLSI